MSQFILVTSENGERVRVNFAHVEGYKPSADGSGTVFWLPGESTVTAAETPEQIDEALRNLGVPLAVDALHLLRQHEATHHDPARMAAELDSHRVEESVRAILAEPVH